MGLLVLYGSGVEAQLFPVEESPDFMDRYDEDTPLQTRNCP